MYGTLSVLDQLSLIKNQTAAEYDEQRLSDDFQRYFDSQNLLVQQMTADLVEPTTVRLTSYGTGSRIDMIKADEYTRADAQKALPTPTDIGFPLDKFQATLQWTRSYLQVTTVADLANQVKAVGESDLRAVRKEIARALFKPTNNLTYVDRFIDGVTLPLRALYNADSSPIPDDEFGNTFNGATHTHYFGTAAFVAANVETLVTTIIEHGSTGPIRIYINRGQEAAVSAMANFDPFLPVRLAPGGGSTADLALGGTLDNTVNPNNRVIGLWDGTFEVWVKPWIYANYVVAVEVDPSNRVLRMRSRPATGSGNLQFVVEDEKYPLRARTAEREYGISVWSRSKAAVLKTDNAVYASPTIT
jgi:hypothetical protein